MSATLAAAEIVFNEQTVEEEAGHAAAAMLQGLDVLEVRSPFLPLPAFIEASVHPRSTPAAMVERRRDRDGLRKFAISIIAPHIGEAYWPPSWPLTMVPGHGDEQDFIEIVRTLGLDQREYHRLTQDAYKLASSREYERLTATISHALEQHRTLDEDALRRIKQVAIEEAVVQHTVKAATVQATDRGEFSAIAAAWTVDRDGDAIIPGAFARTIQRWQASRKRVPVHWNHRGEAANVIGSIDPASMRETDEGLYVEGKLDIDTSNVAREAWRSMRNNAMSLSFGYLTSKSRKRGDGITELLELDLFEISIVPGPSNPDTRILEMKALGDEHDPLIERLNAGYAAADRVHAKSVAADELRRKSEAIAREFGPITVKSFDC